MRRLSTRDASFCCDAAPEAALKSSVWNNPIINSAMLITLSSLACTSLAFAGDADGKRNDRFDPCAAIGTGFVQVAGSETCVRVGGHVRVDVGVMSGTASLGGSGLGSRSNDGPSSASYRGDEDATGSNRSAPARLRAMPMGVLPR